jgi:hypothetical protein
MKQSQQIEQMAKELQQLKLENAAIKTVTQEHEINIRNILRRMEGYPVES